MVTSGSGRDDGGDAPGSPLLTLSAGIVAVLALAVGIGVLLRPNPGTAEDRPPASTSVAGTTVRSRPSGQALRPPAPQTAIPPRPLPVREPGGDCSAGGISAHWVLREGRLSCERRDEHRIGEECSLDGAAARWEMTPDRRWVCLPEPVSTPPSAGRGGM